MTDTPEIPCNEPGWCWRNCRSIGFGVQFWVFPWGFRSYRIEDLYGGIRGAQLGPFDLSIHYNCGNSGSENWLEAKISLSEVEAYDRAYDAMLKAREGQ